MTDTKPVSAVILGGYVNGYSIIRELHECDVPHIWLLDTGRGLASFSNKLEGFTRIRDDAMSLKHELLRLTEEFGRLVLYPTSDRYLELLHEIKEDLPDTCFLPFDPDTIVSHLDKWVQYENCERLGVPYPRSVEIIAEHDLDAIKDLQFPVLVKPTTREDQTTDVFRNLLLPDADAYASQRGYLAQFVEQGTGFLASEVVPGDDTLIYAYTAYRSPQGEILREWAGKKLTQYPDKFGVFSSSSNEAPEQVRELGRKLVQEMGLVGIAEPEFKYDARDDSFKLMEINLRSMMWHRLGNRLGVQLQHAQWLDALDLPVQSQRQKTSNEGRVHFVYMKHELINLLFRWGYWRHFIHNVFGGDDTHFAVFNWRDPMPSMADLARYPRMIIGLCLRKLHLR